MKNKYTQKDLNKLLESLTEPVLDDAEAYDIADGILYDEPGLREFLVREKGIKDPQGWLADHV